MNLGFLCTLPTFGSGARKISVTKTTPFEHIIRPIYLSLSCAAGQEPSLTCRLSSNQKRDPAVLLKNAADWARVLERACQKKSRQRKASEVEIIINFTEPQVLFLSFWCSPLTSIPYSMNAKAPKTPADVPEGTAQFV